MATTTDTWLSKYARKRKYTDVVVGQNGIRNTQRQQLSSIGIMPCRYMKSDFVRRIVINRVGVKYHRIRQRGLANVKHDNPVEFVVFYQCVTKSIPVIEKKLHVFFTIRTLDALRLGCLLEVMVSIDDSRENFVAGIAGHLDDQHAYQHTDHHDDDGNDDDDAVGTSGYSPINDKLYKKYQWINNSDSEEETIMSFGQKVSLLAANAAHWNNLSRYLTLLEYTLREDGCGVTAPASRDRTKTNARANIVCFPGSTTVAVVYLFPFHGRLTFDRSVSRAMDIILENNKDTIIYLSNSDITEEYIDPKSGDSKRRRLVVRDDGVSEHGNLTTPCDINAYDDVNNETADDDMDNLIKYGDDDDDDDNDDDVDVDEEDDDDTDDDDDDEYDNNGNSHLSKSSDTPSFIYIIVYSKLKNTCNTVESTLMDRYKQHKRKITYNSHVDSHKVDAMKHCNAIYRNLLQ